MRIKKWLGVKGRDEHTSIFFFVDSTGKEERLKNTDKSVRKRLFLYLFFVIIDVNQSMNDGLL